MHQATANARHHDGASPFIIRHYFSSIASCSHFNPTKESNSMSSTVCDVTPAEMREKLKEYASFVDTKLHPELAKAVEARELIETEIAEYKELKAKLQMLQKDKGSLDSLVNLGHEIAYCQAKLDDPSTVIVHVGMGFHAELTLAEAVNFIEKRINFLVEDVLSKRTKRAKAVAEHLESSLFIMEQLERELASIEKIESASDLVS
jgi:prefoldin alpha subunit